MQVITSLSGIPMQGLSYALTQRCNFNLPAGIPQCSRVVKSFSTIQRYPVEEISGCAAKARHVDMPPCNGRNPVSCCIGGLTGTSLQWRGASIALIAFYSKTLMWPRVYPQMSAQVWDPPLRSIFCYSNLKNSKSLWQGSLKRCRSAPRRGQCGSGIERAQRQKICSIYHANQLWELSKQESEYLTEYGHRGLVYRSGPIWVDWSPTGLGSEISPNTGFLLYWNPCRRSDLDKCTRLDWICEEPRCSKIDKKKTSVWPVIHLLLTRREVGQVSAMIRRIERRGLKSIFVISPKA